MEPNRERLKQLVAEAREVRGLTKQADFIKATTLGKTTIHRFERGDALSDAALQLISLGIGWTRDSAKTVLNGGNPTLVEPEPASSPANYPPMPPSLQPLRERLPKRVQMELDGGEVLDAEIYDLTVNGGVKMITVVVADPVNGPRDYEELRRTMRAYERIKRLGRGQTPLPWEPGDPEEWKADSEA